MQIHSEDLSITLCISTGSLILPTIHQQHLCDMPLTSSRNSAVPVGLVIVTTFSALNSWIKEKPWFPLLERDPL